MRKQFRDTAMDLSLRDDRTVMLFGDVSVYLFKEFQDKYPDRFYNLGICENTMISAGAGMSSQGLIPFIHTITPFLTERSFEQIKLDMSYNRLSGNILTCGATFDYAWDGATHQCYTDLAILSMLPNLEVIQPGSRKELDVLLRSQYANDKCTYYRLSDKPHAIDLPAEFGKAVVLKDVGAKMTIMTAGPILANVLPAVQDLDVNLVYFHTIKPIDRNAIIKFKETKILVVHDAFGLFEAISRVGGLSAEYYGLPEDKFCDTYGTLEQIRQDVGLDVKGIREKARGFLNCK
ncbi:MAG: hypothetical protein HY280_10095 [Nitrospinae bacterium]|nr:hypothetical protein [Nitrospinota bacterium]